MADDIRIAIDTDQNPKVRRLVKELGGAAGWGLVGVWLYTARHRPKGILTGILRDEIEGLIGWRGKRGRLIGALERHGFIEWNEDGDAVIHDWPKHQPWIYHSEERSERARQAVNTRYTKPKEAPEKKENGSTECSTERSTDSSSDSRGKRTTPSPSPSPYPYPKPTPILESVDSRIGPLSGPSASYEDPPKDTPEQEAETKKMIREAAEAIGKIGGADSPTPRRRVVESQEPLPIIETPEGMEDETIEKEQRLRDLSIVEEKIAVIINAWLCIKTERFDQYALASTLNRLGIDGLDRSKVYQALEVV